MDIQILEPNAVSWEAYKKLRLKALKEEPQAFATQFKTEINTPDEEWEKRLKQYRDGKSDWMFFASNGLELVGMLGAYQTDKDKRQSSANIIAMFVSTEARGKGVSKLLMIRLLDRLTKSFVTKVKLQVNKDQVAALKLYQSFGFKITGKENIILGDGKSHTEYDLEKELEL